MNVMCKRKASLLLDVILATVLILILSYTAVSKVSEHITTSRITAATTTTTNYAAAISQYKFEMGKYPDSLADLAKKGDKTADGEDASDLGPWVAKIEKDPWDRDYVYEAFTSAGKEDDTFVVYSKGKNGSGSFNQSDLTFSNNAIGSIGK